jgi:hypothetical protein
MEWVIYFFGSGIAYFLGVALVLASVLANIVAARPWQKSAATLSAFLGLLLIAASATPLPYWYYALAGTVTIASLIIERSKRPALERLRVAFRVIVAILWLGGVAVELPYHFTPAVVAHGPSVL